MEDWSKYGFEDYAETFDSMGIKTMGDLLDVAPELEDMGLVGLCDALGIPKNKKPEPAPVPTPSPSPTPIKKTKVDSFLTKAIIVCFVLMVLIILAVPIAARLGIIKSNIFVSLPSSTDIPPAGVDLILVDTERNNKVFSAPFSSDGTGNLEVRRGEYELYLAFDGQVYGSVDYCADGMHDTYLDLKLDGLLIRPVIVRFRDEKGEPLAPQSVTASVDGDTDLTTCERFTDTDYIITLPNEVGSPVIEFTVEGYAPVQLQYDFGSNRVSILEVTLYEA